MSTESGQWDRRSIYFPGLHHGSIPIPTASRVGAFIATGGIRGVDVRTGELAPLPGIQAALMFDNLVAVVTAAGGTTETILKIDVSVTSRQLRTVLDEAWLLHFPNPKSRPSRHLSVAHLPAGMLVQCEALALAIREPEAGTLQPPL